MQITIPMGTLKAAIKASAKKDVRYYLQGVMLRTKGPHAVIAATDGVILFSANLFDSVTDTESLEFIIPADACAYAAKLKCADALVTVADGKYSVNGLGFAPIDDKFPDISRALPASGSSVDNTKPLYFNPERAERAQDVMREHTGEKKQYFPHNIVVPSDLGVITRKNAICVFMPLRYRAEVDEYATYDHYAMVA